MKPTKQIHQALVDSQKRVAAEAARAQGIVAAADKQEEAAVADIRRLRRRIHRTHGRAREIAEAEYLDAVDRKGKAARAGAMARSTLRKLARTEEAQAG